MDPDQMICYCGKVTVTMIKDAVKRGAATVEEVGAMTAAGVFCGGCKNRIRKVFNEIKEEEKAD